MSYREWNGYLCRVVNNRVSFVLPEVAKYTKRVEIVDTGKEDILEDLRKLLALKCHYKTDQAKKEYLIDNCGVESFKEFESMNEQELLNLMEKINEL